MLGALLGRIRVPEDAELSIKVVNGNTTFKLEARSEGREPLLFEKTYPGQLLSITAITDLLSWLKYTAKTFWGSESGGL